MCFATTMQVTLNRLPKAIQRMEGLAEEIGMFWQACSEVHGSVVPGGGLDLGSLSRVNNARDRALTTIRTLDLEIFEKSGEQPYRTLRKADPQGQAVRAVLGPRNQGVHGEEVFDPDIAQALGPIPGTDFFVILPRWRSRSQLPPAMFEFKGAPNKSYQDAYDRGADGRPVLDSLLDAFAFFERCDSRVVNRDAGGQIPGFPLAPLPIANRYRRLHPDWLSERDWNATERDRITSVRPGGAHRSVEGYVTHTDGLLLCGVTATTSSFADSFVEPLDQVIRDILLGYRYLLARSDRSDILTVVNGQLHAGGQLLNLASLHDLANDPRPWVSWRDLCLEDASYYRVQRQQPL